MRDPLEVAAAALLKDSSTDLYRNRAWDLAPTKTKDYYREKTEVVVGAYLDALRDGFGAS